MSFNLNIPEKTVPNAAILRRVWATKMIAGITGLGLYKSSQLLRQNFPEEFTDEQLVALIKAFIEEHGYVL